MNQDIPRMILKQQRQLQSFHFAIERCEGALLDLVILLESLKKLNKELENITAKSGNGAKRHEHEPKPSSKLASNQRLNHTAASRSTDGPEYYFRKLNLQNKQSGTQYRNKYKN